MTTPARDTSAEPIAGSPLLLKPEEAAVQLRISRTKIYDLLRRGVLRSVKIDGLRRIPMSALTDYVADLDRKSAA
jgi:excisionase family DNA binding protein